METNTRFFLNEDCLLISGAKRGAIYVLTSGDVYSIDESALKLIKQCEEGLPVVKIIENENEGFKIAAISYLESLVKEKIGQFSNANEKIKKITIEEPSVLDFIWLEVAGRCNLRCVHCYLGENPVYEENTTMSKLDWKRVMTQAHEIGCRKLQFIGGEPFLEHDKLFTLVAASREIGYEFVEVYTNATLLDEDKINFLHANKVNVAISVYGMNSDIHDKITRTGGSFSKTILNLRQMITKGIQVRVGVVAMSINEEFIDQTVKFLKNDIGVKNLKVDPIRPIGCGCNKKLIPINLIAKQRKTKPDFSKCNLKTFQRAFYGHNCFSKNICVTNDGKVIPCIMEREIILGDIFKDSLQNILNDVFARKTRKTSKDFIETCKDCEYRYCCFDCRPKAKNDSGGNFFAKPSDCFYNPYTGEWLTF